MTFAFDNAPMWMDLLGVFFFAVSGSLLAARKEFDIMGSLLLASLVGLGGGVIRDLILNTGPPAAFSNPAYLFPPVLATGLVYFLFSSVRRFKSLLTLFDAGGLALFCMTGTLKALAAGMNPWSAVMLGVMTAVGGGLLRDVTANEVPELFNPKDIYALPAFAGAGLTAALWVAGVFNVLTAVGVAAVVFTFRILAWRRSWHAPLAVHGGHRRRVFEAADGGSGAAPGGGSEGPRD
jgi:uncharacterized membrane protein YeiH